MGEPDRNPLELEILAEKAAAYFETVQKMEDALRVLREFVPASPSDHKKREQLVDTAAERVCFFLIQREAMRLGGYEEVFAEYQIPLEVRNRMGAQKRHQ